MNHRNETVQSFARGLDVLRSFGAERRRQTITEVAERTGMTRAAARRFLYTLCERGFARSDGKHFELTPAVLEISHAYLSGVSELESVREVLHELTRELDEMCADSWRWQVQNPNGYAGEQGDTLTGQSPAS